MKDDDAADDNNCFAYPGCNKSSEIVLFLQQFIRLVVPLFFLFISSKSSNN